MFYSFKLGAYVSSLYASIAVGLLIYAPNFRKTVGANTKEGGTKMFNLILESILGVGIFVVRIVSFDTYLF